MARRHKINESRDIKKIEENGIKVFQSNDLLEAQRQAESIDELRIFYIGLRGILPKLAANQDKYDKEFPETFMPAREVVRLFGGNGAYYTKLEAVCEAQSHRTVAIRTEDGFIKKPIYSQIQYIIGKGLFVTFNPLMKPYILDLADNRKGFTELIFDEIFALRSVYSWKLLEIIRQWVKRKDCLEIKLENLRERLGISGKKYQRFADFKRNVLEKSLEEINRETVFEMSYETIKTGRKIAAIKLMWRHKDLSHLPGMRDMSTEGMAAYYAGVNPGSSEIALGGVATLVEWQQNLYEELVGRPWKVTTRRANDLVRKYSESRIRANISYCAMQKIEKNPGGYLWRAIRENYACYEESSDISKKFLARKAGSTGQQAMPTEVPVKEQAGRKSENYCEKKSALLESMQMFIKELNKLDDAATRRNILKQLAELNSSC